MSTLEDEHSTDEPKGRLDLVLSVASDGFWDWDVPTGRVFFSPKWCELLGYRADEVEPSVEFWEGLVHPDDMARVRAALDAHFSGKTEMYECENRLRRKNGTYRWNLDRGRVVRRGTSGQPLRMVGVDIDISDRKRAELALAETTVLLKRLHAATAAPGATFAERALDVLYVGCEQLRLPIGILARVVGQQYEVIEIVSPPGTIARGDVCVLGDTFCREVVERRECIAFEHASASRYATHPCYRRMGLEAYIGMPVLVEGDVYGALNFSSPNPRGAPFTPANKEVVKLMAQWLGGELARERHIEEKFSLQGQVAAQSRLAAVGRTAAVFAHEVSNPLNGIALTLQNIQRRLERHDGDDDAMLDRVSAVQREVKRLGDLLDDFRVFSQPPSTQGQLADLAEVVRNVAENEREAYEDRGITVELHLAADLPAVRVAPNKLHQVVLNLCKNAVEAMPEGGRLVVRAHSPSRRVVLEVTDSGCGVPDGVDVFAPFVTTKPKGTGLGLPVVRQIVEASGGSVAHWSAAPQGTTFGVELPFDVYARGSR